MTPCHVVVGRTQVMLDYPYPIVFKSSKIHNSSNFLEISLKSFGACGVLGEEMSIPLVTKI
jgi:hypothetical protein